MKVATNRPDVEPEHLGDLRLGPVLPIGQVQDGSLPRRERPDRVAHMSELWSVTIG